MRSTFAFSVRACCFAMSLMIACAFAAEEKPSLLGATREQVETRHGEPRSVMTAGGREILFYARERFILRNGVVVEIEPLYSEPPPRATPSPPPAAAPAPAPKTTAPEQDPAPVATPREQTPAPAAPSGSNATAGTPPPAARSGSVSIKLVRPPTGTYVPPPPPAPVAPSKDPASGGASSGESGTPTDLGAKSPVSPLVTGTTGSSSADVTSPPITAPVVEPRASTDAAPAPPGAPLPAVKPTPQKPVPVTTSVPQKATPPRKITPVVAGPPESSFSVTSYVIVFILIAGGAGFAVWRRRHRQLEPAATTVTPAAFSEAVPVTGEARADFTAATLSALDWAKFEQLVASYFEKTGVVASHTRTGQASAVHIKISWKGEARPFALVQCIAQPNGLVDVSPIQRLAAALAAEDIRRGYVFTSGKFSVAARDLAEEKHLTLLPGELFLEKLNALPDSARAELMQEIGKRNHSDSPEVRS